MSCVPRAVLVGIGCPAVVKKHTYSHSQKWVSLDKNLQNHPGLGLEAVAPNPEAVLRPSFPFHSLLKEPRTACLLRAGAGWKCLSQTLQSQLASSLLPAFTPGAFRLQDGRSEWAFSIIMWNWMC